VAKSASVIGLVAGLGAAISLVACRPSNEGVAPATPTAPLPPIVNRLVIRSTSAVRWSANIDSDTRRALETGRRRLVINVEAYEPPSVGAAILVVRLLTANQTTGLDIARFGVYPNVAFRASPEVEPKRFQISLTDQAALLEGSGNACRKRTHLLVENGPTP
jgi:hypothetical protein